MPRGQPQICMTDAGNLSKAPDWFGKTIYKSRLKRGNNIPWGYQSAREGKMLDPINEQLDLLRWGLLLLHTGATYEDVATWLSNVSKRYISKEGLRKLCENERTRRLSARALRARYATAEETKDWRDKEVHQTPTYYPTDDEQAFKDFGVVSLPTFGRARKHNSLIAISIEAERSKRIKENSKYRTWLQRTSKSKEYIRRSKFFKRNGIKLGLLANDN